MAVLGNLGTMFVRDKNGQMVPVPVIRGEDGGFYTPEIKDGVIRWAASRPDMPEVPDMDIGTGGGGGTPDAVQFVPQVLTDKQQAQARENIGAARTYTLQNGETIDDAPEDADIVWDPENEGEGAGDGTGGGTVDLTEVHERIDALEDEIEDLQTSGLTTAQVNALDGMFKIVSFTKDPTAEYSAFKAAFGIEDSGEVEPDEPDEPEVTLTSISATYSGGDVAVGTALSDLTGIVVTATYSDGSAAAVTGYTLSGEIAEGSNTITVTYQGKTATFTVTGVTESVDENAIKLLSGYLNRPATIDTEPYTNTSRPNAATTSVIYVGFDTEDTGCENCLDAHYNIITAEADTADSNCRWWLFNEDGNYSREGDQKTSVKIGKSEGVAYARFMMLDGSGVNVTAFTIGHYKTDGTLVSEKTISVVDMR